MVFFMVKDEDFEKLFLKGVKVREMFLGKGYMRYIFYE